VGRGGRDSQLGQARLEVWASQVGQSGGEGGGLDRPERLVGTARLVRYRTGRRGWASLSMGTGWSEGAQAS
jgi:hypothetical protein